MKRTQRGVNPYLQPQDLHDQVRTKSAQQRIMVNEDGVPLYQHDFSKRIAKENQSPDHKSGNIPRSREKGYMRPQPPLAGYSIEMASSARPKLLASRHYREDNFSDESNNDLGPLLSHAPPGSVVRNSRSDNYCTSNDTEEMATDTDLAMAGREPSHDPHYTLAQDNKILNKLLNKLSENKAEIMAAHIQIDSLESKCSIKDDHIKSLRRHISEIESAKQYAERTIYEYSLKMGNKYEKSTGEARTSTREAKIQTRLQSKVLSTVLDRANVKIQYNVDDFVQEENEDSDETRILTSSEQKGLTQDTFPPDHIIDVVVSRHKTIEQELLKEGDFIPLCKVCSHTILRNQIAKQEAEKNVQKDEELNGTTPRNSQEVSESDNGTYKVRTLNEQIDDNMRLSNMFDTDFYSDIETIKLETVNNLAADYLLQMAVLLPNTHNLLIHGLEKVCQYRTGLHAINFTNPFIRLTLQGNFNNVHDAQVPQAFTTHTEQLQNKLILSMQNELILRQRFRFNSLLNEKIPQVLFSHNTKNTNVLHVESMQEHYLKYFRNFREYREITPADVLYEATRGLTSRYYENYVDRPQSDKDQHQTRSRSKQQQQQSDQASQAHKQTVKPSSSAANLSVGGLSAVYMGHGSCQYGQSENESVHTQLQMDPPNSIYDISNSLTMDSDRMATNEDNLPTEIGRDDLPSVTYEQTTSTSPSCPPRKIERESESETHVAGSKLAHKQTVKQAPRIIPPVVPKTKLDNKGTPEEFISNIMGSSVTERSTANAKAPISRSGSGAQNDDAGQHRALTMPAQHLPDIAESNYSIEHVSTSEHRERGSRQRESSSHSMAQPLSEASPLQQYRRKISEAADPMAQLNEISTISDIAKID